MTTTAPDLNGYEGLGRTPDIVLAEKTVLGSCIDTGSVVMNAREYAEQMIELLPSAECFSNQVNAAVYSAIKYLTEDGKPATPANLLGRLVAAETGVWRTGNAGPVLSDLSRLATPLWVSHARDVLRASVRRRALLVLKRAEQMVAETADIDFEEAAARLRADLDEAFDPGAAQVLPPTAGELFFPALDRIESGRPPGNVRMPWEDLHALLGYLRPGQLVTIGARPSLGKSVMGLDIARYTAIKLKIPSILFTIEQDRDEVMDRLIAAESGVELHKITTSGLEESDLQRLVNVQDRFADSKLIIDDTPGISLAHIRARLRGMARHEPAGVAIVDYLQLMAGMAGENRQREVSAAVSGLKVIAREFRIPVVMLCQLNRGPEGRADKRPYISDARESGSVENDSDIAILIHREDHYDRESPRAGEADFIVDKNRNGPRATVTVAFQGYYARFVDLAWTPHRLADDS